MAGRPGCFPLTFKGKNLQKECKKLQVIKRKNHKNLLLLGKCAGGSLISARLLCPVDGASVRSSSTTAWEFSSRLLLKILREWKILGN